MTRELYTRMLQANHLRRELASSDGSESDAAALVSLEQQIAGLRKASGKDEAATFLNTKAKTILLGPESTGLDAQVMLNMAQVPTSIVHLFNEKENPLVTVRLSYSGYEGPDKDPPPIKRVRVTSQVEGYSARAVATVELRLRAKDPTNIPQLPTFFPSALGSLMDLTRATLNVTIEHLDSHELEIETTRNIWLMPRTTAVLDMKDPSTGEWKDVSHYLAAYVTPNSPEIMSFLATARTIAPGGVFRGYLSESKSVNGEVEALFTALRAAKIGYVNSVIAWGDPEALVIQRVRLPRESLKSTNANCVDGTVLFASLLEAISVNASLVILPGHALVGWQTWTDGPWKYLETTKIGTTATFAEACNSADKKLEKLGSQKIEVKLDEARTTFHVTPME